MSTLAVAKKDFKDTRRTRTLWLVVLLLTVLGALMAYVFSGPTTSDATMAYETQFLGIARIFSIIIPIVALISTYLAIAGERDSGSIKFMLSLPNTRLNVFAGKLLSRGLTVTAAIVLTFGVVAAILAVRTGAFPVAYTLGTIGVMALYSFTFVALAIAMSSAVTSRSRAIAGAVGSYFLLVVFYIFPFGSVTDVVGWINESLLGQAPNPDLYDFAMHTSPFIAFQKLLNFVAPLQLQFREFAASRADRRELANAQTPEETEAILNAVDMPIYLTDEFSFVVMGFWILVPLAIGYWRFERADLG